METLDKKVIGLIMTYNCGALAERTYKRLPKELLDQIICVDDGSTDNSVKIMEQFGIPVFTHPHAGYGGNLLFGLRKAIELGATQVVEIHGDGQYDFASIIPALNKLDSGYDLILGNRFYKMTKPLSDGMDLVRYFGNIFLSSIARFGLGINARDFFSGFRAYSCRLVNTLGFSSNSENYFFSFELIAQAHYLNLNICWVPTHCDYKGEHTSMKLRKGIPAILHTIKTTTLYRLARCNIKRGVFATLKDREPLDPKLPRSHPLGQ